MNRFTEAMREGSGAILRGGARVLTGLALVAALAACEDPLEVEEPEFLTPEGTDIELLVAGAIGDFQVAYSGGGLTDRFLSTSSLIADELMAAGTFPTRRATDRREQFSISSGNTSDAAYIDLHQARRAAIRSTRAIADGVGPNDPRISLMKVFEGFSIVAFAEGFCSNVPLSEVTPEGELVDGQPLTTSQLLETAIQKFDEALSIDAGNLAAAVGKGRALLDLGRFQEAAAAVAGVPTSFVRVIEHSSNSSRQENPIFNLQSNGRYSLSDQEGTNGVPFRSAQDPRVPWVFLRVGFDESADVFQTLKAAFRNSPVILADGIEARLIEAEAALNANDVGTWLSIHNALRADVANLMADRILGYSNFVPGPNNPTTTLDPLSDPGSQDARVDLHFEERAFWLHLTGHRLGDLRRLVRQYGRSPATVYPVGGYHFGGVYSDDVNLPLEFDERNNPNWTEDLCDVNTV